MKFAVIQFPGSNCDFDLLWAIRDVMGQRQNLSGMTRSHLQDLMEY